MSQQHPSKRNILRTLWISRRLVAAALLVGTLLWFILTNNQNVTVYMPFGLGQVGSSVGIIVLASALVGAAASALILTVAWALRRYHYNPKTQGEVTQHIPTDRPPDDYAAQTREGFSDAPWSAR